MSEAPHTPEPWKVDPHCGTMIWTAGDAYGQGPMLIADIRGWGHLTGQGSCRFPEVKAEAIQDANANRIVSCVNACAGLADPQATIAALVEALKAAQVFIRNGVALGYIRMPDPETNDPASQTPDRIRAALALVQP